MSPPTAAKSDKSYRVQADAVAALAALQASGARAMALWAMEQALRSGLCAAVIAWSKSAARPVLRRLQLAAAGSRLAVLFRPPAARRHGLE